MDTYKLIGAINKKTFDYIYPITALKEDSYMCPDCKKDVIFKKGKINKPHFSHKATHPCTYYRAPSHEQIHTNAQYLLKDILEKNNILNIKRNCSNISGNRNFQCYENNIYKIEKLSKKLSVKIEHRFQCNNNLQIADIAVVDENDEIKYIFEIYYTHKTKNNKRPEPWFEINANDLISNNDILNLSNEINIDCIREEKCQKCIEYDIQNKINNEKYNKLRNKAKIIFKKWLDDSINDNGIKCIDFLSFKPNTKSGVLLDYPICQFSNNLFKTSSWENSWDYYSENSIEDYVPTLEECHNFKMPFENFMISFDNFNNNSIDDSVATSIEYLKTSLITTLDIVCVNEDKPLYGIQILYYPPNKTYPIGYIRNHKLNELKEIGIEYLYTINANWILKQEKKPSKLLYETYIDIQKEKEERIKQEQKRIKEEEEILKKEKERIKEYEEKIKKEKEIIKKEDERIKKEDERIKERIKEKNLIKKEKAIEILKKLLLNKNYLINYPITKITNEITTLEYTFNQDYILNKEKAIELLSDEIKKNNLENNSIIKMDLIFLDDNFKPYMFYDISINDDSSLKIKDLKYLKSLSVKKIYFIDVDLILRQTEKFKIEDLRRKILDLNY